MWNDRRNASSARKTMANSVDRARWLQLAEQWAMLSRMPRPKAILFRNNPIGLWRGEPSRRK